MTTIDITTDSMAQYVTHPGGTVELVDVVKDYGSSRALSGVKWSSAPAGAAMASSVRAASSTATAALRRRIGISDRWTIAAS